MTSHRVLVATLPPYAGGVPAKTKILVDLLRRKGHRVTVGYYATWTDEPEVGGSVSRLLRGGTPSAARRTCFGDVEAIAVGCWLPELEFTYYWPSKRWQKLILEHDRHIATGGTALISYPFVRSRVPHLIWCASTMIEDRRDRRAAMPLPRRAFDWLVIGPVQAAMERTILTGCGRLLVTSSHTRHRFSAMGRAETTMHGLPVPVDSLRFSPPATAASPGVIGFAGRITDPRKNLVLLLDALACARRQRPDLRLRLTGEPDARLRAAVAARDLGETVEFRGVLSADELPEFYRSLDLFVIPSHQEGFGIVGAEALACGVPVVSTRCGGPEDFVIDGRTGFLTGHDAAEIARRIVQIVGDRHLRRRLSEGARTFAVAELSLSRFERTLDDAARAVWGAAL